MTDHHSLEKMEQSPQSSFFGPSELSFSAIHLPHNADAFALPYVNQLFTDFNSSLNSVSSLVVRIGGIGDKDLNAFVKSLKGFLDGREGGEPLKTYCKRRETVAHHIATATESIIVAYSGDILIMGYPKRISTGLVQIMGDQDHFGPVEEFLRKEFEVIDDSTDLTLELYYYDRANQLAKGHTSVIRSENLPFTEMYPFLNGEPLEDYYERFHNSSSSILLLRGQHGTGKSSFIRGLLLHLRVRALMTFDEDLITNNSFFVDFLSGSRNYFIIEDADAFLRPRENGNNVVNKFLNIGDGIVSNSRKKIILTTNLDIEKIDPALIRPGRCFDVLEFKPLTREQAQVVAEKRGIALELPKQTVTIAEMFNTQNYTKKQERAIGFLTP